MKKFSLILLALILMCGQAFAYTITRTTEERFNDATTGDSYKRINGTFALDSSHPAEGETLLPSQLGLASFTRVSIGPGTPPGNFSTTNVPRKFAFDYTNNRFFVLTANVAGGGSAGAQSYGIEVSGPVTYDLSYLTRVPFEAVGPIS